MDNENQNEQCLTLGSLFDGSGGFPLGGSMAGIKPLWASEIEPFPIRVTTKRFPNMKHYGDVSAINGFSISPVDILFLQARDICQSRKLLPECRF